MTSQLRTRTVFLAGGTGTTGRRVAARLVARDVDVVVGSRRAPAPFDWDRPETWDRALGDRVDAAYLAYSPDLAVPGAAEQVAAFTATAREHGADRVVLLSGRGEPGARSAERAVLEVAPTSTVLRSAWMDQNFSEGDFLGFVRAGAVPLPVGPVGEPFVDVDDIADAAVATLLEPGHEGRVHELTGPRPMTFAEAVAVIGAARSRALDFRRVTPEEFAAILASAAVPEETIALVGSLFADLFDGRNSGVGTGVRDVLGRPPRSFETFAADAAATGVWDA